MSCAFGRRMSDARQSPIPQDRVDENIDQQHGAETSKQEERMNERHLEAHDQGDPLAGTNPDEQPGIPDEPQGPAEGGD
jgi:hypothetical protein